YIVMEFIEGITYEQALSNHIPINYSFFILEKILSAVKYAHSENIIHHDIKPSNILLGKQGQVKLADFGLAMNNRNTSGFANSSFIAGTLSYMAPEALVSPGESNIKIDTYSLGCLIYHAMAGYPPFSGENIGDISYKIINQPPPPFNFNNNHTEFKDITLKCLNKNPDKRPAIDEIQCAIIKITGSLPHSGHNELKTFINKYITDDKQRSNLIPSEFPKPGKVQPRIFFIILLSCIITAGIIIFYFLPHEHSETSVLPSIPGIENSVLFPASQETNNRTRKFSANNPAPLSSPDINIKSSTVIISGISNSDTIFIDKKRVTAAVQHGKHYIRIAPGQFNIKIHLADNRILTRNITIMPYQKLVWNLNNAEDPDGR
ncbi:MAG: serine/threonine-protein kinase, partial [bacterium]